MLTTNPRHWESDVAVAHHERVGRSLELLGKGLKPFVERECKAKYGDQWAAVVARRGPEARGKRISLSDIQTLLKVMIDEWHSVFSKVLGPVERSLAGELVDVRNRWAHQYKFSSDDAYRALDSVHRLLQAVSAADEAAEVDRAKQELLRSRFEEQARSTHRRQAEMPIEGQPKSGLRAWREIVTPHADVASGRYQQAEFAADLAQVLRGDASPEYRDPREFFRRTFLTEGLSNLLAGALRRLSGAKGDPLVELQTNFGGGKTHSMLALYHLVGGTAAGDLPGVEELLTGVDLKSIPNARRAVLVGTAISPGQAAKKHDGCLVRTLWGELAWQLGGAEGYEYVAEADATGTSPGSSVLVEMLKQYSPCLVLIDEWVAYARQLYDVSGLPAGSFDAHFTFAQALAEAVRAVPTAMLVVSIPASDIEIGGDGGREALERLKNVIGRMESAWRPATAEEGFEIVRRRLFEPVGAELARERDAVVKGFTELYRGQSAEFPSPCKEAEYERRMRAAYPIHPELFDRLYGEWSTLDKFQRTRGVLRLMAAVIHELWERQDSSLLILPGAVPIDAPAVSSELTRYLDDGWPPVIDSDVDGPNSLPLRLDRENPALGRYSASRRVARSIYMGSAPVADAANRGIDDRSVKLSCCQPGETPATFGDALRRLTDQATYLYVDKQRYWYSLQANVTRLAHDRAAQVAPDDVDEEIRSRLRSTARHPGEFRGVHVAPSGPFDVRDDPEARLVVLGPEHAHIGKTDDSPALTAAAELLDNRGAGARRYRNMLVFLAPDKARLEELRQATRQAIAWSSIDDEREQLNLDSFQRKQAETKRRQGNDAVDQRIPETYQWLLSPSVGSDDPTGPLRWDETRVTGQEPIAERASRKLAAEEGLISRYSAARLRMDLDRVPLWRGDHVGLRQLWEDYAQYLYLPRLADQQVLLDAVRDGLASFTWSSDTFAYAEAFDDEGQRYRGLVAGEQGASLTIDGASVLVQAGAAQRQLQLERPPDAPEPGPRDIPGPPPGPPESPEQPRDPSRFYGRTTLEPVRALRDLGQIVESVVQQLTRIDGAEVTLHFEVDARAPGGFPDDVRRTVSENARTLKFDSHEFEE
jgi:predicted AAA+ superfamily ATPase